MKVEDMFNTPEARAIAEKNKKKALKSAARLKPSKKVWAVVNGLEYLTAETIAILTQRGQEWFDEWPLGEPMYSRNDGYQFVIHANQVAQLLDIPIRTAQELLKVTRQLLGKAENRYVSVKEFCKINELDEEDARRALRDIPPNFRIK
ncbi:hypothetical protein [Longitalea arenae]|uniref:hypothetical protein n=1 Tax=Longitalea arenae TaxID=2812558 RepID=UPI0019670BD0|nr:hypothetical protein [Longitalea arenae]